jgi:hypothetical protein
MQIQSGRAFSFFERRLASAAQNASIQASDRALHHVAQGAYFWMGSAWKRSFLRFIFAARLIALDIAASSRLVPQLGI